MDERSYASSCHRYYTYIHLTGPGSKNPGRVFYVGKGSKSRAWARKNRNQHWHRIVNLHGCTVKVCAYWDREDDAHAHERFLIDCFRGLGFKLANLTDGGEGVSGWVHSEETIKRLKEIHKGKRPSAEQLRRLHEGNRGSTRTLEQRKRIGAAMAGRSLSEETKDKLQSRIFSEGHKEKLRLAKIGKKLPPDHVKKIGDANRGKKRDPEIGLKVSLSKTGKKASEETKAALRAAWVIRKLQLTGTSQCQPKSTSG